MGALTKNFNGTTSTPQQGGNGGIAEVLEGKKYFFVAFYGETVYKRAMETAVAITTDSKFDNCSPISIAEPVYDTDTFEYQITKSGKKSHIYSKLL